MDPKNKKPQVKQFDGDNLIEQLRDIGRGVGKTVKQDVVSGITQDALSALFNTPHAGDMRQGQEVRLNKHGLQVPERKPQAPHRRDFLRSEYGYSSEALNRLRSQETQVAQKIEEIRLELKALMATLAQVDNEIKLAVSTEFVDPGAYHLNFLDRIKTMLQFMRKNLNESRSWLTVMRSKRKQRHYWAQYKKKGTEWGLNPERMLATQVG